jgi:hypothetical protein
VGRGTQPLASRSGGALAPAASLPSRGLRAPDRRPRRPPTHGGGGGDRSLSPDPSAPGTSRPPEAGASPGACPGCPRGCWGGGRETGLGASAHLVAMEAVGQGVPAALGLWGAPDGPHARHTPENHETAGMGGGARGVAHACAHPAAACAGLGGLAHVGHPAGPSLATRLLGGGRAQRCSGATPSPPARVPAAAVEGVDARAYLRLSGPGRPDARGAVSQAEVSRPFGDRASPDRDLPSASATNTGGRALSLKSCHCPALSGYPIFPLSTAALASC